MRRHTGLGLAATIVMALALSGLAVGWWLRPADQPAGHGQRAAQAERQGGSRRPAAPARALHDAADRSSPAPLADAATTTPAQHVAWGDPKAVIGGYLRARYAVGPADAGRRHRRHAAYLHPEAAALELGHRPTAVPARGRRTITVDAVERRARAGDRASWRVWWTARDPDGATRQRRRDLVLARHDRRWLVRHDTAELDPAPDPDDKER
jgi:hypothetical protein